MINDEYAMPAQNPLPCLEDDNPTADATPMQQRKNCAKISIFLGNEKKTAADSTAS